MSYRHLLLVSCTAVALMLNACGGGGSSATTNATNTNTATTTLGAAFQPAWNAFQQQSAPSASAVWSITVSGTAANMVMGSYPITGSGTVTQTTRTTAQQSLEVTRVYAITAQVAGNTVPQLYTDVSTYDPSTLAYLGGTFTDGSGSTSPKTTHDILWTTTAADSFSAQFLNLPDTTTVAATRSFRLSPTGQLLPVNDDLTTLASVQTAFGPLIFNAAIRVVY
jgi:hypothetical protein